MLKKVGIFREFHHSFENYPSIKDMTFEIAQPNEVKIIQYLEDGNEIAVNGKVFDLLSKEQILIGLLEARTDGVWDWRSDYAYYVRKYHIRVPEEFVLHMEGNNWVCPKMSAEELVELIKREKAR